MQVGGFMFQKLIFDIAVSFILRQVAKYLESTDFEIIRQDLRELVRKTVIGDAFDDVAVEFIDRIIDCMVFIVTNAELAGIIQYIKDKNIEGALKLLKDLLERYLGINNQ